MIQTTKPEKNFYNSFRFIVVFAEIFGFFPVQGILSNDVKLLKFSWFSVLVFIAIPTWLGGWYCACFHIKDMINHGYDPYDMNGVVFNFSNGSYCLLFIILAKNWPNLMDEWSKAETFLVKYGWPKGLNFKLKLISFIFLSLEAFEHLTVQINKIIVAFQCKGSLGKSSEYFFATMTFFHIFNVIDYTPFRGIFLQLINTRLAFCWTYVDLFLILICTFVALRFKQITKRIKVMKQEQIKMVNQWRIIREDYKKLCVLCMKTDQQIAHLILLSFFTNCYFIIFHLFRSLNVKESALETAYFAISFGLLILRIWCVCWYGGWVDEEAKAPARLLMSVPSSVYNVEIERFIDTIRFEEIGITGKHLFKITKGLIIQIANAIVTYELVVIQINGDPVKKKVSKYSLCE